MSKIARVQAFAFAFASFGMLFAASCSSAEEDSTPKKTTLEYGCSYTEIFLSDYVSAGSTERRGRSCKEGVRCDEIHSPAAETEVVGGELYTSQTVYGERENFIGTCANNTPVTGISSTTEKCEIAPVLCTRDPHCMAIRDCTAKCDEASSQCEVGCIHDSDAGAVSNFYATRDCAKHGWKSDEVAQVFPPR